MSAPDTVREQYEALPYPPRDPAQELRNLRTTLSAELRLASSVFWGGRNFATSTFRALDAGCGTGDSAIFLAEQLKAVGGQVVGVDLSETSLKIARERAERRGLNNVRFLHGRIENLADAGLEPFDFVVSLGVLHHLPDPSAGLKAITALLKEGGGLSLMVYAEYGRTPIYQLQRLFQFLAPPALSPDERIAIVKRTLNGLNSEHWASLGKSAFSGEIKLHGDAGIFDLFLHAQDRAYTIPQLYDWLDDAALELLRFDMPLVYEPGTNLPGVDTSGMDARTRHAVAELLNGRIRKHTFFARRGGDPVESAPRWDNEDAFPAWLVHDPSWAIEQVERRPQLSLFYDGLEVQCALDGFRRDFLRFVDGQRSLREILRALRPQHEKPRASSLLDRWGALHQALNAFGLLGMLREPVANGEH